MESDYITWDSKTSDIGKDKKQLAALQNEIIKTKNAAFAYFFSVEYKLNPHIMQKVILDKADAKYAVLFARDIMNADIKALQSVVVARAKIKYIDQFDTSIEAANHKLLQILILAENNPHYLFELAKRLTSQKTLVRIQDMLIDARAYKYLRLFAEHIKCADIEKIERAILDSGDSSEVKKFARHIKNSKMRQFLLI